MSQSFKTIGVFTSGGDAPGMNAAIRAVTRTAVQYNLEVVGIIGGYQGMLNSEFELLQPRGMANILQRGGTILKTGRCPEFLKPDIRSIAVQNLKARNIDALVCIGGDGSFTGAHALWIEHKFPIIGIPGTIDNDIWGTDVTIGFDTAVNTALDAIDRIRDTADSHDRLFIVEVMGRNTGFIAAHVGLAGGAEDVIAPDYPVPIDHIIKRVQEARLRGKKSSIIITAEGEKPGRAYDLAEQFRKRAGLEAKVAILGHQQRGGSPTANDRILASRMGALAVDSLLKGQFDKMVGVLNGQLVTVSFEQAIQNEKRTPEEYLKLVKYLAI
jgi:6-phosphofructokinase 1